MKLRKIILVASTALATVAVMAPMAQAEILHNGSPVSETDVLHYEGVTRFDAGPGFFFECPVTGELHISAAGIPSVQSFVPDTTNCTGGGPLVGCDIASHSFSSGAVHVNTVTPDLTITDSTTKFVYGAGCSVAQTHLIFPETTLKPHTGHSLDTLTLSGTAGSVEGTTGGLVFSGLLHITEDEAGIYTLST